MKNAILFWFYKDIDICINRLELLKKYNPQTPIHGLFGGKTNEIELFNTRLHKQLDSFTACYTEKEPEWKWKYGDLLIANWYEKAGQYFDWDRIVIAQWDMLILTDITNLIDEINPNELYLSGIRPVYEVKGWWNWVKRDKSEYDEFLNMVYDDFGKGFEPMCCQFIFVCMPKDFLEKYYKLNLEKGFIEYRLPTLASALGFKFGECATLSCYWPNEPEQNAKNSDNISITAQTIPIGLKYILKQLLSSKGDRVFHPYYRLFPNKMSSIFKLILKFTKEKFN